MTIPMILLLPVRLDFFFYVLLNWDYFIRTITRIPVVYVYSWLSLSTEMNQKAMDCSTKMPYF